MLVAAGRNCQFERSIQDGVTLLGALIASILRSISLLHNETPCLQLVSDQATYALDDADRESGWERGAEGCCCILLCTVTTAATTSINTNSTSNE